MVQKNKSGREGLQALGRVKVKVCDFSKVANIQKEFKGRAGLCDPEKRIIWIDHQCRSRPVDVKGVVLEHEKAHLILHDLGIKWDAKTTERFCDYYAVVKAPKACLTDLELLLREQLTERLHWPTLIQMAHGRYANSGEEYRQWQACGEGIE